MDKPVQIKQERIDYTSHAAAYDERRLIGKGFEYLERNRRNAVVKLLGIHDLDREVLDVGCGTGRGLCYLAATGFTKLTGFDYTPAMLARAREKLSTQFPELPVPLIQGDAFSLAMASQSFDAVLSLNVLHLFPFHRQLQLVRELHRVCRPGGRVIVELENIHKALFVTRYLEQRRDRATTKLNNMWEAKNILPRDLFDDVRILGVDLPVAHRFLKHIPRIGWEVEKVTHYPPLKWLAGRILVGGRRRP